MEEIYCTGEEAAKILGCSEDSVAGYRRKGILRGIKVVKHYVYRKVDVEALKQILDGRSGISYAEADERREEVRELVQHDAWMRGNLLKSLTDQMLERGILKEADHDRILEKLRRRYGIS